MSRHRILRFNDVQGHSSHTQINRPPCFGKQYDYDDMECRIQCPHRAACAPVFRAKGGRVGGASVPDRTAGVSDIADETLPEVTEVDAEDESFVTKLSYNAGLQALEAVIREGWFAVRSVPRKRYFPHQRAE